MGGFKVYSQDTSGASDLCTRRTALIATGREETGQSRMLSSRIGQAVTRLDSFFTPHRVVDGSMCLCESCRYEVLIDEVIASVAEEDKNTCASFSSPGRCCRICSTSLTTCSRGNSSWPPLMPGLIVRRRVLVWVARHRCSRITLIGLDLEWRRACGRMHGKVLLGKLDVPTIAVASWSTRRSRRAESWNRIAR